MHELNRLSKRDGLLDKKIDESINRLENKVAANTKSLISAKMDISSLKARASFFGVVGGMIPVLIMVALLLLSKMFL